MQHWETCIESTSSTENEDNEYLSKIENSTDHCILYILFHFTFIYFSCNVMDPLLFSLPLVCYISHITAHYRCIRTTSDQ